MFYLNSNAQSRTRLKQLSGSSSSMVPFIGKVQNRNKEQMSGCLGLGGGDLRMMTNEV